MKSPFLSEKLQASSVALRSDLTLMKIKIAEDIDSANSILFFRSFDCLLTRKDNRPRGYQSRNEGSDMPDRIDEKIIYLSGFAEFSDAFVDTTGSVLKSAFSGAFVDIAG